MLLSVSYLAPFPALDSWQFSSWGLAALPAHCSAPPPVLPDSCLSRVPSLLLLPLLFLLLARGAPRPRLEGCGAQAS